MLTLGHAVVNREKEVDNSVTQLDARRSDPRARIRALVIGRDVFGSLH